MRAGAAALPVLLAGLFALAAPAVAQGEQGFELEGGFGHRGQAAFGFGLLLRGGWDSLVFREPDGPEEAIGGTSFAGFSRHHVIRP